LNDTLKGQVVYSDAAHLDEFWCERLFCATKLEMEFAFGGYYALLHEKEIRDPRRKRQMGRGVTAAEMDQCRWLRPRLVVGIEYAE